LGFHVSLLATRIIAANERWFRVEAGKNSCNFFLEILAMTERKAAATMIITCGFWNFGCGRAVT
jgi:hypothetical protein